MTHIVGHNVAHVSAAVGQVRPFQASSLNFDVQNKGDCLALSFSLSPCLCLACSPILFAVVTTATGIFALRSAECFSKQLSIICTTLQSSGSLEGTLSLGSFKRLFQLTVAIPACLLAISNLRKSLIRCQNFIWIYALFIPHLSSLFRVGLELFQPHGRRHQKHVHQPQKPQIKMSKLPQLLMCCDVSIRRRLHLATEAGKGFPTTVWASGNRRYLKVGPVAAGTRYVELLITEQTSGNCNWCAWKLLRSGHRTNMV